MPQLDPTQWFIIFTTSWLILIYYAPIKISNQIINLPSLKPSKFYSNPWLWPWQ